MDLSRGCVYQRGRCVSLRGRCVDPRVGVRTHIAAVVDEAGQVAHHGGIDDGLVIHTEQVAGPDA